MLSPEGQRIVADVNEQYPSLAGVRYERYPDWWDVWCDGSVVGTLHLVPGGWVFYVAGRTRAGGHLPAGVGTNRDDAVRVGLRQA